MAFKYRLFTIGLWILVIGDVILAITCTETSLWRMLILAALPILPMLSVPNKATLPQLFIIICATAIITLAPLSAATVIVCVAAWTLVLYALIFDLDILPLNSLDYGLIATTYEGRPVSTRYVLDTKDPFEFKYMQNAVKTLVDEVPLLRSFIRESPWQVKRFVSKKAWFDPGILIEWYDAPLSREDVLKLDDPMDLQHLPPFRLSYAPQKDGGFSLVLALHHAASDGTGGFLLLNRLLCLYEAARLNQPSQASLVWPPVRFRDALRRNNWTWWRNFFAAQSNNLKNTPLFNANLLENHTVTKWHHSLSLFDISPELWRKLQESAKSQDCTRFQLIVGAALRAAVNWRTKRNKIQGMLRPLLPADMRGQLGITGGLQNFASDLPVTFSPSDISSAKLIPQIKQELKRARSIENLLSTPFCFALLRTLMPFFLFRKFLCMADQHPNSFRHSFLLSHPRPPRDFCNPKDIVIERLWCTSTMSRQPGVGWVITEIDNSISLVLQYNEPLITKAGAHELNALFLEELRLLADGII